MTTQAGQAAGARAEKLLIVVPDDFPPVFADSAALMRLRRRAHLEVRVFTTRPRDEAELIERTSDAHTVLGIRSSTRFTHTVIEAASGLRHIALWGTATDNVAMDAARRAGIVVSSTPRTATTTVAEHSLALALALARRIPELDARVREGDWPGGRITQLAGKTMGIVGTGAVGMRLAELAHGIGMDVLLCPMHDDEDPSAEAGMAPWAKVVVFEDLLRNADVVSVHARLSSRTERMFGAGQFALMKPTALFINTARGRLVDEAALAEALLNDTIDGAALDVFDHEPLPQQSLLRHLPNVVLSPHIAAATNEALNAGLNMAVDNIIGFLEGRPVKRVS